jgi:hypothetical protein
MCVFAYNQQRQHKTTCDIAGARLSMARNLSTQHVRTLGRQHQRQRQLLQVQVQEMWDPQQEVGHQTTAALAVQGLLTHLHHTHRMHRARATQVQPQLHPMLMLMEPLEEAKPTLRRGTIMHRPPEMRVAAPQLLQHLQQHQQSCDIRIRPPEHRSATYILPFLHMEQCMCPSTLVAHTTTHPPVRTPRLWPWQYSPYMPHLHVGSADTCFTLICVCLCCHVTNTWCPRECRHDEKRSFLPRTTRGPCLLWPSF